MNLLKCKLYQADYKIVYDTPRLVKKYTQTQAKVMGGIIGQGQHEGSRSSKLAWVVKVI